MGVLSPVRRHLAGTCGPLTARVFHTAYGLCLFIAWVSLASQVELLMGSEGLLPVERFAEVVSARNLSWWRVPTFFLHGASDGVLVAGCVVGMLLAAAGTLGAWPRVMWALSLPLYLSYAVAAQSFLSFQWDNMLLEAGLLAMFLPRNRRATWAHLLLRVLLFKLYFQSGLAKWQSHLGDWHDGSAMSFYYETAPIPGLFAWAAHHLPAWWHTWESWAVLGLELAVPLLFFAPRGPRKFAALLLTFFQVLNLFTANYGFFILLTLALHLMLLDDEDLQRWGRWLRQRVPVVSRWRRPPWWRTPEPEIIIARPRLRRALAVGVSTLYLSITLAETVYRFTPVQPGEVATALRQVYTPFRLINTYHLFGHITRQRIEPEVQVRTSQGWQPVWFHHKPGPLDRRPPWVTPHQPRVDFQLWFHGLNHRRTPPYVMRLLQLVCTAPAAVQDLFVEPLPPDAEAVRMVYWRYHFTSPEERAQSGNWWRRQVVGQTRDVSCPNRSLAPGA